MKCLKYIAHFPNILSSAGKGGESSILVTAAPGISLGKVHSGLLPRGHIYPGSHSCLESQCAEMQQAYTEPGTGGQKRRWSILPSPLAGSSAFVPEALRLPNGVMELSTTAAVLRE